MIKRGALLASNLEGNLVLADPRHPRCSEPTQFNTIKSSMPEVEKRVKWSKQCGYFIQPRG